MACPFLSKLSSSFVAKYSNTILRSYAQQCPVVGGSSRAYSSFIESRNGKKSEMISLKRFFKKLFSLSFIDHQKPETFKRRLEMKRSDRKLVVLFWKVSSRPWRRSAKKWKMTLSTKIPSLAIPTFSVSKFWKRNKTIRIESSKRWLERLPSHPTLKSWTLKRIASPFGVQMITLACLPIPKSSRLWCKWGGREVFLLF